MHPEIAEVKRQAEEAGVTQTEIAFHAKITRPKVNRLFRGYELATSPEIEALAEGLRAAIREKARKLRQVLPGVFAELTA